jgi:hypothetical protein
MVIKKKEIKKTKTITKPKPKIIDKKESITKPKQDSNGLGIAGLILGIGSIILSWVPFFGFVSGIIGLILSMKQRKIIPNGIATGGLVTSIIGIVLSVLCLIIFVIMVLIILKIIAVFAAAAT